VIEGAWPVTADPKLAKGVVAQRLPTRRQALAEDLLAVSDEQKACPRQGLAQARIVDRRHHGLAGAGG